MDDRRAADEQDLLPLGAGRPDRVGNGLEAHRLGLLARDVRAHEAEQGRLAGPLERHDPHPGVADDDRHAKLDLDHRHAPRRAAGRIDGDAAVHLLIGDVDPVPAQADLGALVGRAVELLGERAGDVGRDDPRVAGVDGRRPVLDQVAEDRIELGVAGRADGDPRVARDRPAGSRSCIRGSRTCRPSGGCGRGSWATRENRRCARGPRLPRQPGRPPPRPWRLAGHLGSSPPGPPLRRQGRRLG